MKIRIKSELCRGCGVCEAMCPDVYQMNDHYVAQVKTENISEKLVNCALQGENICPTHAITHE